MTLMLQPESSSKCFERLMRESTSRKLKKSLESIRKACDELEKMKGVINYTKVAEFTTNHFNTPRRQTIMNSERLRLYIDLRKDEYEKDRFGKKQPKQSQTSPLYPSNDLDLKTITYIDQLRSRNSFLEKQTSFLRDQLTQETKVNPISYTKSIKAGAYEGGAMEVTRIVKQGVISSDAKDAIEKLLSLTENPNSYLKIMQEDGEKQRLILNTPSATETVLYDEHLKALRDLLTP